jgi:phage shock protein PspC (stress-responsive transcriptional regulator)
MKHDSRGFLNIPQIPEWTIRLVIWLAIVGLTAVLAVAAYCIAWLVEHIRFV